MMKNKFFVLLISLLFLLGSSTVDAAAYKQQPNGEGTAIVSSIIKVRARGEIKPKTKMRKEENKDSKECMELSPEEIDLLARLVRAEAEGEPFLGKVGVAATVLNRLESDQYPDTIPEIIYQHDHGFQYCPVRNGQINKAADNISVKAVKEAIKGKDPTGGALSFYNPAKSGNYWIRTRIFCKQIGNHIFVK
ncbi:MAG: spore cortex-lytic enzyme [Firmicutes bacterium]|nr:spore cortex-lytic enzyme [Bacillota bacterium]